MNKGMHEEKNENQGFFFSSNFEKLSKNVVRKLEQTAKKCPEKLALIYEQESITYKELHEQSNQLAHYLKSQGVEPGGIVGVCIGQSTIRIIAFLAVLKTGAAYLPIDGELPQARIQMMIQDANIDLMLTVELYLAKVYNDSSQSIALDFLFKNEDYKKISIQGTDVDILPENPAYIIYTSGSTGLPKGVAVGHQSFYNFIKAQSKVLGLSSENKTLQFSSPSFDAAIIDIWTPLIKGASVYLYPNNKIVGEPLLDYIVKNEIDTIPLLPPMVLSSLPLNKPFGDLKTIAIGGEACSENTVKKWYKRINLINSYGPTEATVAVTNYKFKAETNPRIIGTAMPLAHLFVLDENLKPVENGIIGELYIGGSQLALGYLNRPEDTQKAFIKAPQWLLEDLNGYEILYKTGDLVLKRPDGNLEFYGRKDDQVKIRGYRIELAEIEHNMAKLPQISKAAIKVQKKENGLPVLVAFVQLLSANEEDGQSLQNIRAKLQQVMPAYMLPDKIVVVDKMPLTHAGKIDKLLLEIPESKNKNNAVPKWKDDNLSEIVKHIWKELLSVEEIKDQDDFFDLGGHSLLLAQLHVLLPEPVRNLISLPELYIFTTISSLVKEVEKRMQDTEISQKNKAQLMIDELVRDSELHIDFDIKELPDAEALTNPERIFLTGVTGFVGSHLLEELLQHTRARIYCLVRAVSPERGLERIKQTFEKFKLSWLSDYDSKVIALTGDLSLPNFGMNAVDYQFLTEQIQVIYHSGSSVSYVQPYELIKKSNIDGLHNVIDLAVTNKIKYLILLSSMGVFSWGRPFTKKTWMYEDDGIDQNMEAVSRDLGYIKSKWVMESIAEKARAKGLPIINFRLGFAVCHSTSGATVMNQWWGALIRSCVQLKSFPLVMGLKDELTTVDYMCKAITHISKNKDAVGLNFHLSPLAENDVSLTDFCSKMNEYYNTDLQGMEYHQWLNQWKHDKNLPIYPLLSLFTQDVHEGKSLVEAYENTYYYDRSNTRQFLADADLTPPVFDKKLMTPYLEFMGVF
ncbi:non-ribosomal peptide synthetase [Flavobacterium chilense]|uniref:Amino acid adenylation domain-containing protein/thioester reductase domain-containing protein n=1 Tax=Flavobacterium chilense TaxID=946677 RepID=A0A1M7A3S4_9FLAO|nr:non-ribosomal peptide synthetase [Flavobacterium chilense]SHL37249.1 amino acid adenylation domain-containing protein/thioester reductase domain-containing protein [Flavobacterium chilense]